MNQMASHPGGGLGPQEDMKQAMAGPARTKTSWPNRLLLLLLGSILPLLLVEVALRVWMAPHGGIRLSAVFEASPYPGVGYVFHPGSRFQQNGFAVQINEQGFPGPAVPWRKPEHTFRILILGDSITMNAGVALHQRYSAVLEQALRSAAPPGWEIQVINTGHAGYNTAQELAYWKYYGRRFEPDLVLVQYFYNDPEPLVPMAGADFKTGHIAWWVPIKDWVKRRSVLVSWLMTRYYQSRLATRMQTPEQQELWFKGIERSCRVLYAPDGPYWRQFVAALAGFAQLARAERTPLLFLIFPLDVALNDNHPMLAYYAQVEGELDRLGLSYFDLFPVFKGYEAASLWLGEKDWHLNELSSRLAGESIASFLITSRRVPVGRGAPAFPDASDPVR